MTQLGLRWTVRTIHRSTVDKKKSRENHARIAEELDKDLVQRYASWMDRSLEWPRLVVVLLPTNLYQILGGNHRDEAFERNGITSFDAYVVENDPTKQHEIFYTLPKALNTVIGSGKSPDEAEVQVINEVALAGGLDNLPDGKLRLLSKIYGPSVAVIRSRWYNQTMRDLAKDAGVPPGELDRTKTTLHAFHRLGNHQLVQIAALKIAIETHMPEEEIKQLVSTLERYRSDAEMLAHLEKLKSELKISVVPKKGRSSKLQLTWNNFSRSLSVIKRTVGDKQTLGDVGCKYDKDTVKKALDLMHEVNRILVVLEKSALNILDNIAKTPPDDDDAEPPRANPGKPIDVPPAPSPTKTVTMKDRLKASIKDGPCPKNEKK